MNKYILALDQGTTSSRAILFNKKGEIIAVSQQEFTQIYPQSGWVEHDPIELLNTQLSVVEKVIRKAGINHSDIDAVGITNQRETIVVWDKHTGNPIHHALVWQDTRTANFCNEIKRDLELSNYIKDNTGLIVDSYFSASKIKWLLDQYDGDKSDLLIGTIDTWLMWKMSDRKIHATDYSNASRTMLFNIKTLQWDDRLLTFFGVNKSMLPTVNPSSYYYGDINIQSNVLPVHSAIGDQQSALFGQGCFNKGEAKNTYGTGCFMLMNTGSEIKSSSNGLLTTIAWGVNNKVEYALEGSVFIAGAAVQWLRDELQILEDAKQSEEMARKSTKDSVYVVPAFVGLGAPHWDETARGLMIGLTRDTNKNDIVKATLNALAYQTKDIFDLMEKESGVQLKELSVDGGASLNNYLMEFQASILEKVVKRSQNHESTAKGAVFMAGLSSGFWDMDALKKISNDADYINPNLKEQKVKKLYHKWKKAVQLAKGWLAED